MKNLKAKLSSLLAVAMLATQLIVPSAFAAGDDTAVEDTQWKTAYEQDFTEAGITDEYLKNDGWDMASYSVVDGTGLMLKAGGDKYAYTTLKKDFGTKYKITAVFRDTIDNQPANGFDLKTAGVNLGIKRNSNQVMFGGTTTSQTIDGYSTYRVEFVRDESNVTAHLYNVSKSTDCGTYTATVPENTTDMYFAFRSGGYGWEAKPVVKSVKVETPESYVAWKTLYKQSFTKDGLTAEDLKNDGWILRNYTVANKEGMKASAQNAGMVFTRSLGNQYKVTARLNPNGTNGSVIKFNGVLGTNGVTGNGAYYLKKSDSYYIPSLDSENITNNERIGIWSTYDLVVTVDGNKVTAVIQDTTGIVLDTLTKTYETDAIAGRYVELGVTNWEGVQRWENVKIEVPETFVPEKKYVTEYTRNFTYATDEAPYTEDEIKAEGWVYSDFMSPTKDGLKADTETSQHAYAWYNKNLGENYIADLSVKRNLYESEQFYFNATVDTNGNPLSGFAVRNGKDWGSDKIKLYKYVQVEKDGKTVSQEKLLAESEASLGGCCPMTLHVEYKDGKIFVHEQKSNASAATISYDATADIAANPELASGVIGGKSMKPKIFNHANGDTDQYVIRSLSVQKPEDGVQFGTLSANVAAGEETVTTSYSVKLNNNTAEKLNGKILAAAYNTNGQLVGIDILGGKYGSMGQQDISGTIVCSEAPATVKVFIFGDLADIEPLAAAATATLAE